MISQEKAHLIANDWIRSWNSHDIDSIMSHYSDDIEFTSPFVIKLIGNQDGTIVGKEPLKEYFLKGLSAYPELIFELIDVLPGVKSITLYYISVKNLRAAEVMHINSEGKISSVAAHYSESGSSE